MQKIVGFLSTSVLLSLVAASAEATDVWVTSTISRISPYPSGIVEISVVANSTCTNTNTPKRYLLSPTASGMNADGYKGIYSAVLYAAAADKTVMLLFDDSSSNCPIKRVIVLN